MTQQALRPPGLPSAIIAWCNSGPIGRWRLTAPLVRGCRLVRYDRAGCGLSAAVDRPASLVLCTVVDPAEVLAEIRRILRAGGTFRFVDTCRPGRPVGPALLTDLLTCSRRCSPVRPSRCHWPQDERVPLHTSRRPAVVFGFGHLDAARELLDGRTGPGPR
jgi:SAM-dependent methyltransferase